MKYLLFDKYSCAELGCLDAFTLTQTGIEIPTFGLEGFNLKIHLLARFCRFL